MDSLENDQIEVGASHYYFHFYLYMTLCEESPVTNSPW